MQHCALIHTRKLFVGLTGALILLLFLVVTTCAKPVSFLSANFFHCRWLDIFFTWFTNAGDGLFAVVIAILLLFMRRITSAIKIIIVFLISGLLAQLLKHLFHAPRPKSFFTAGAYTHFIDGVTHSGMNSFPSGHTTTAFAVAAILAFTTPCRKMCCIFFMVAMMVGYSRVYLGQHFLEDVLAGIIVGTLSAVFIEYLYPAKGFRYFNQRKEPMKAAGSLSIEL